MAEPTLTAAARSAVLIKIFGAPACAAAVTASISFAFMSPKSKKEAFRRFFVTLLASIYLGPLPMIAMRA